MFEEDGKIVILDYKTDRVSHKASNQSLIEKHEIQLNYYKKVLNRVSNRENTSQFYNGVPGEEGQYFNGRQEFSNQDFLALVIDYDKENKIATLEQRNKFSVGDVVEVFGPSTSVKSFEIKDIMNEDNEYVKSASHAQEIVKISMPFDVCSGDIIRVKIP